MKGDSQSEWQRTYDQSLDRENRRIDAAERDSDLNDTIGTIYYWRVLFAVVGSTVGLAWWLLSRPADWLSIVGWLIVASLVIAALSLVVFPWLRHRRS